jgi:hypothetical protein
VRFDLSPNAHCSHAQATGYGLLISVLLRERGDFDGFLRFWRRFLTPGGLMYWQLLRGGDGEVGFAPTEAPPLPARPLSCPQQPARMSRCCVLPSRPRVTLQHRILCVLVHADSGQCGDAKHCNRWRYGYSLCASAGRKGALTLPLTLRTSLLITAIATRELGLRSAAWLLVAAAHAPGRLCSKRPHVQKGSRRVVDGSRVCRGKVHRRGTSPSTRRRASRCAARCWRPATTLTPR